MLNYTVKIESVKDLMELKKITNRYGIKGTLEQNGFHSAMGTVFKNLLYLPLDHVNVAINGYSESQIPYITNAMNKLSA